MPDILHKAGIQSSSVHAVYEALTTIEGLSGWWTETTCGDTKPGGVIEFQWAVFLPSLKSLMETGTGRPAPNDLKLDSWE